MCCQKCGTQNPDDGKFCSKCGLELSSTINTEKNALNKPKERSIILCIVYSIITLGIYFIYWLYKTKNEMVKLGADIPTFWLAIIPIVNIYFLYKYTKGAAHVAKKSSDTGLLYFVLWLVLAPVAAILIQVELNKLAE